MLLPCHARVWGGLSSFLCCSLGSLHFALCFRRNPLQQLPVRHPKDPGPLRAFWKRQRPAAAKDDRWVGCGAQGLGGGGAGGAEMTSTCPQGDQSSSSRWCSEVVSGCVCQRGGATDKGRPWSPSVRLGIPAQGGGRLLPQRQLTFCLSVCRHPACVISGDTHSHPVTSAVSPPHLRLRKQVECSGLACRAVTDE